MRGMFGMAAESRVRAGMRRIGTDAQRRKSRRAARWLVQNPEADRCGFLKRTSGAARRRV